MNERKANVTICGRSVSGYPQHFYELTFFELTDLITQVDSLTESLGYRRVDVFIDGGDFDEDELLDLEDENFIVN